MLLPPSLGSGSLKVDAPACKFYDNFIVVNAYMIIYASSVEEDRQRLLFKAYLHDTKKAHRIVHRYIYEATYTLASIKLVWYYGEKSSNVQLVQSYTQGCKPRGLKTFKKLFSTEKSTCVLKSALPTQKSLL